MQAIVEVQVHLSGEDRSQALKSDVLVGMGSNPKSVPPTWFYDEVGSSLFDDITQLPEYYVTRAERAILSERSKEIIEISSADTLVELGSGSSNKTRLLLDAMAAAGSLEHFVPFDVSESVLLSSAMEINKTYGVPVTAIVGDFRRHLPMLPQSGTRLVAFLGGTIGNLDIGARHRFLTELEKTLGPGDFLLIGTDLEKDVGRLIAAYDDAAGVTSRFNRNVLSVLNNELNADFDIDAFQHVARWNDRERHVEMWLRSAKDQVVTVRGLDLSVYFEEDEEMLTEVSAKFTEDRLQTELEGAHFVVSGSWTDEAGDFLVTLAQPYY
jgi:L-histidine Nalpha-methyltransferase